MWLLASEWLSVMLILACGAIYSHAAIRIVDLQKHARQLQTQKRPTARENREQFRKQVRMEKQQLAECTIDKGTSTVEMIHRIISKITFGILECIPPIRYPSKLVRKVHDKTSSQVYTLIREINRDIGTISQQWQQQSQTPASRPISTTKKAPKQPEATDKLPDRSTENRVLHAVNFEQPQIHIEKINKGIHPNEENKYNNQPLWRSHAGNQLSECRRSGT
ncbi:hypothetical protein OLMES_5256 [Oleiphilus messinensis]|uniref:Uncharacterized protein n=1 Tax=Oleiphilus messinensis TaxID=141451 RepID=A0A1Y0IG63_9GAMM|nr:hypothetical protein [Oleiphilus messinensis]ARU59240.1 hypothetical protein OLMES_5256 [Oleiphilus messinensis]